MFMRKDTTGQWVRLFIAIPLRQPQGQAEGSQAQRPAKDAANESLENIKSSHFKHNCG
jgi:hypothetical protein